MARKKKTSRPTWTEAQWKERGYTTIKIRIPAATAEQFRALAEKLGANLADTLAVLLEETEEKSG